MFNGFQKIIVMAAIICTASYQASHADPNVYDYAVPTTIHTIVAKAQTISANFDLLKKISSDYANGYRIKEATYTFTAPDRLEYKTSVGLFTVTYTTTDTERIVTSNVFHLGSKMDISKDITKRNTIAALGLLPQNYLDTMRIQYLGQDNINGVATQDFIMRYLTDQPNDNRRFEFWVDPIKHYVVQKRVWGGDALQHETIEYKDPKQIMPGFWMPTRAEAYTPDMELAGVVGYDSISAS
jgi:hypothetical protein